MAVRLRLRRMGKRNRPFYRICAIEGERARDAKYIESIGHYDPFIEDGKKKVQIDKERAEYWLSVGARPSPTVLSFLRDAQVSGLVTPVRTRRRRRKKPTALQLERLKAKREKLAKRKQKAKSEKKK